MNLVPQQLNKQQIQLQFDGFLIRLQQELVWQVAHPRHPQVGSCGFAVFLMVTRPPRSLQAERLFTKGVESPVHRP